MKMTQETYRRRSYSFPDDGDFEGLSVCWRTQRMPNGTKDDGVYYRVRYCHVGGKGRNLIGTFALGKKFETMREAVKDLKANHGKYLNRRGYRGYPCAVVERSGDGGKTYPHWLVAVSPCPNLDPYPRQRFLRAEQ